MNKKFLLFIEQDLIIKMFLKYYINFNVDKNSMIIFNDNKWFNINTSVCVQCLVWIYSGVCVQLPIVTRETTLQILT